MNTKIVVVLTDDDRRALSFHYGEKGLATRATVRGWVNSMISAAIDDIHYDYQTALEHKGYIGWGMEDE